MKRGCISTCGNAEELAPHMSLKASKKSAGSREEYPKFEVQLRKRAKNQEESANKKNASTDPSTVDPSSVDPSSVQSDSVLVEAARKGDKQSFRVLVERHQSRAFGIAYEILRSKEDAEDVIQESFVKAYLSLASFRGQSAFYTWLYRIVYNMSIDFKRRQGRRGGRPLELQESALNNQYDTASKIMGEVSEPGGELARKELRERIQAAMAELSEEHRAVILLREFEGLNYDDIAKTIGVSKGTVMSRLHYGRKRLQQALQDVVSEDLIGELSGELKGDLHEPKESAALEHTPAKTTPREEETVNSDESRF